MTHANRRRIAGPSSVGKRAKIADQGLGIGQERCDLGLVSGCDGERAEVPELHVRRVGGLRRPIRDRRQGLSFGDGPDPVPRVLADPVGGRDPGGARRLGG